MNQFEEWTDDEDLLLAEIVLRHIRENSTMLNAFDEAGQKLNRTTAACGYRWNSVIRHLYINSIVFAKKQREVILMRADKRRKKWRQEENELHKRIGNIKDKIQSITDEALKKGTCFQMVNLHNIEKQLILYTKGHFGRIDYENDLKYFAAELYGLSPEQVEWYSIINMVIDLYQQLIDGGLISFKLMNFLSETFRRAFREENSNQVDWNTVTRQMLAEIQGMPVLGTGLKLGEVDLSLIK